MTNERIISESQSLYSDIDCCITELLKARTEHNSENEGKALFKMEGLMVSTLQHLACIIEQLSLPANLDEAPELYPQFAKYGKSEENWYFVDGQIVKYVNGKRI